MIDLLMIALFQAVAGAPAPAADAVAQEQAAGAAEDAATAQPEAAPAQDTRQYRRERRCREVEVTGRRMPQRVCQNVMVPIEPTPEATAPAPQ